MISEVWKNQQTYARKAKYVPIEWLLQFKGNNLRKSEEEMMELQEDLIDNGLQDPLWMSVGKEDHKIKLGEGNHRLEIFRRLGLKEVPIIVGLQNKSYESGGFEPYYYPHLNNLEDLERGLIHPDKVFSKYEMI